MAKEITKINETTYLYVGAQRRTLHSFAELASLKIGKPDKVRRFLEGMGMLTVEWPDGKREVEFPETAEGMLLRLKLA